MQYIPPIGKMGDVAYIDGDPALNIGGDAVSAKAWEHPMREILQVITDAGLTPDGNNLTQLSAAIRTITRTEFSAIGIPTTMAAGTPDALVASFDPALALKDGVTFIVRAAAANSTTTPTLAIDGGPNKPIVKGSNKLLVPGDIAGPGHWLEFQYDAFLGKFVLQNPATGVAQTLKSWVDKTGTRAWGTTYTNGAKPRLVMAGEHSGSSTASRMTLAAIVDGLTLGGFNGTASALGNGTLGSTAHVYFEVPPGAIYRIDRSFSGGATSAFFWMEAE